MIILAIDPGYSRTAWAMVESGKLSGCGSLAPNSLADAKALIQQLEFSQSWHAAIVEVPLDRDDPQSHYFAKNMVAAMKNQGLAYYIAGLLNAGIVSAHAWQGHGRGGAQGKIDALAQLMSAGCTVKGGRIYYNDKRLNEHEIDAILLALWRERR